MLDESLTKGEFPSCQICRKDPEARKRWGCDAPVSHPYLEMSCSACWGSDVSCEHCNGVGRVPLLRCPWRIISRYEMYVVDAAMIFLETGALPDGGSLDDQAATFVDALKLVAGVRAEVHEKKMSKG